MRTTDCIVFTEEAQNLVVCLLVAISALGMEALHQMDFGEQSEGLAHTRIIQADRLDMAFGILDDMGAMTLTL